MSTQTGQQEAKPPLLAHTTRFRATYEVGGVLFYDDLFGLGQAQEVAANRSRQYGSVSLTGPCGFCEVYVAGRLRPAASVPGEDALGVDSSPGMDAAKLYRAVGHVIDAGEGDEGGGYFLHPTSPVFVRVVDGPRGPRYRYLTSVGISFVYGRIGPLLGATEPVVEQP